MLKKRNVWILLACLATTAMGQHRYVADTEQSRVYWEGNMILGGGHEGFVELLSGVLIVSERGIVTEGEFTIDMNTIFSTDMGDDHDALDDHLKNEDFFDVEKFPYANFSITSWGSPMVVGQTVEVQLTGQLTMKGKTHSIAFPAQVSERSGQVTATAEVVIDRTWWGVNYSADNIFETAKDGVISNSVPLTLNLVFDAQ